METEVKEPTPMDKLIEYWRLVEMGKPHLVSEGLRLTREVIGGN